MHVTFRESHGLEEVETPTDLGQSPGDLVVLSFSDSDLGAFAAGWHSGDGADRAAVGRMPTLRLANLAALKHPLSVDTYLEQTLSGARAILIRLIGGVPYWPYGLAQVENLARARGIALAVLPGDGRVDTRLDKVSTLPVPTLRHLARLCDMGGGDAARAALALLAQAGGLEVDEGYQAARVPAPLLQFGAWTPDGGVVDVADAFAGSESPRIAITFYRAYLSAGDMAPVKALFAGFRAQGYAVVGLFAPSLKAPGVAAWLADQLCELRPAAIVNVTAFSGKSGDGPSPLDAAGVPVFQVTLATSDRAAWAEAERGLSPADLAMHVVLPEVDGRISAGVASFKEADIRDDDLQFSRHAHRPASDRIAAIVARVHGWVRLGAMPVAEQKIAVILSTYPGKDWQMGHAVGLDALKSGERILAEMRALGHAVSDGGTLAKTLPDARISWPLAAYQSALATLPQSLQQDIEATWGAAQEDSNLRDNAFHFTALRRGNTLVALQLERGDLSAREGDYHNTGRTPRHFYVAFYLWLRAHFGADALVHVGTHGTLEWLPGKAVALSETCWPEALVGDLPVIYPFIVNDPGEAAQAKRRIGAVTLGHIPPPLRQSATPDRLVRLEALLDEFSNADGLDPARRDRLQGDIRVEAQVLGVEDDLGLARATSSAEAITRIDRFVCDIKESQFGDGLHIYGEAPGECEGLRDALSGKRVAPGPSGSPYRGRSDVLPTGRNLFTTDPRAVPSRAAYAQGVSLAQELIRRHLQEEGDWPRGLIVDLWGSATMRTAGEEFAMALHLLGVKPVWDKASERVSGIEVLPISDLDRPRLDVTLRVSGLFRDVFPTLSTLFAQAVRALSLRDEAPDWNPYAGHDPGARVYGPEPGQYGLGMGVLSETYDATARAAAGQAWLDASAWAMGTDGITHDPGGIAGRVASADSFVHLQDLQETDLLLANDYATHEGGFAAAKALTGGRARLYHLDNTIPETPRARTLPEEIARVVRARASNPNWIAGMQRHGFRGAAEIAATLDHMASFAHLAGVVAPHLFDLYHDATLGDPEVADFLKDSNFLAYEAMKDRFQALHEAGLWATRRNSIRAGLDGLT